MHATADIIEALPPHSIEAEEITLASILMEPKSLNEVRGILTPESFFQPDYRCIFESILAVADAGKPPNPIVVREHLAGRGILEEVGGNKLLIRLARDTHFTSDLIGIYAAIIAEKAKLRELMSLCDRTRKRCILPTASVELADEIATGLERAASLVREVGWADSILSLEQISHLVIESKESQTVERFPTGITDLDNLIGGIPISGNTLIAGKAGMGKSQFCKQIARNVATGGVPVGLVAIEESAQKIGENYLAGFSGIENNKIVYNRLGPEDWREISAAIPRMAALKLYVDDAQQKLSDIERTIRRMVRKYGCRMIIVDHLHLIDCESNVNRVQQVTMISGGLKKLFKELKVAGIVAAQMNRGGGEHDAAPELWNLRDSGSLEQDGDLILQLHRQDYFDWKKMGADFRPTHNLKIYVNKNKAGGVGWVDAYFDGDLQMVRDWNGGFSGSPFA